MTLLDLRQLVCRYWKAVVILPVACALLAVFASMFLPSRYEASASITVSDPSDNVSATNMLAVVNDLVQSSVAPYSVRDSEIEASVKIGTDISAQTLVLTIEAPDKDESLQLVNSIVTSVADEARATFDALQEANEEGLADLSALNTSEDVASVLSGSWLQNSLGSDLTFEFCSFMVNEAQDAEGVGAGKAMMALEGLVGGLFLVLLILVVMDVARAPIKSREEVEKLFGLPALNPRASGDLGEQLWANTQFTTGKGVQSVCLVPLSGNSAEICAPSLRAAAEAAKSRAVVFPVDPREKLDLPEMPGEVAIYQCASLNAGMGAAYCAHAASATVVCVRLWKDSLKTLESAMRELAIAKANVVGIAFLGEREGQAV